jgi:hypothetical protein
MSKPSKHRWRSKVLRECVSCGTWFEVPRKGKSQELSNRQTCGPGCANEIRSWALVQAHQQAKKNPEAYMRWVGRDYSSMGVLRQQTETEMKEEARKKTKAEQARARYHLDPEKRRARSREYQRKKRLEMKNATE